MQTHAPIHLQTSRAAAPALRKLANAAFSLIELLTAVSIMMVIIYALYAMFNQTQKALRGNITQVDVMESGRAAMEMIARELEELSACHLSQGINIYAGLTPAPRLTQMDVQQDPKVLLRTNVLCDFFFLSRQTNKWFGTGYRVYGATDGIGTLYRINSGPADPYGVNSTNTLTWTNLMYRFANEFPTNSAGILSSNFNRVAEGIIHLRLTAYDPEGRLMDASYLVDTNSHPAYRVLRLDRSGREALLTTVQKPEQANVILQTDPKGPAAPYGETQFRFISNALPAYLELELGVLEPTVLKQYQSMKGTPFAQNFLAKQAAKVHLFRQRIPIRTAQQ